MGHRAAFRPAFASPAAPGGDRDLARIAAAVEDRLSLLVAPPVPYLASALRHAVLAPSKRVRPIMLYLMASPATDDARDAALTLGAAVEMVHTASLILDDLPCMDDAHLRRSRPTTHIAYGQPTAILGAIALLSRAFGLVADLDTVPSDLRVQLSAVLSRSIGWDGLVAGQMLDLAATGPVEGSEPGALPPASVETIHALKTGALFLAAIEMGAMLGRADASRIAAGRRFAQAFGLAFQAADDLLDRTRSTEEIGKDAHQDERLGRSVLPLDETEALLTRHMTEAREALAESGADSPAFRALLARLLPRPMSAT